MQERKDNLRQRQIEDLQAKLKCSKEEAEYVIEFLLQMTVEHICKDDKIIFMHPHDPNKSPEDPDFFDNALLSLIDIEVLKDKISRE